MEAAETVVASCVGCGLFLTMESQISVKYLSHFIKQHVTYIYACRTSWFHKDARSVLNHGAAARNLALPCLRFDCKGRSIRAIRIREAHSVIFQRRAEHEIMWVARVT